MSHRRASSQNYYGTTSMRMSMWLGRRKLEFDDLKNSLEGRVEDFTDEIHERDTYGILGGYED